MTYSHEYILTQVNAPAIEPVSLAEAKLYLRIDQPDYDTVLHDNIVTARILAEKYLRQSLITQSLKLSFGGACGQSSIRLPMGPVQSIVSLTLFDREESSTVVDSAKYRLNATKDTLLADDTLSAFRVEIVYNVGYGAPANVPVPIKQGILAHVAELFEGESCMAAVPPSAASVYMPFREIRL